MRFGLYLCLWFSVVASPAVYADQKPSAEPAVKLTLYNWNEYIDTELVQAFEKKFNVDVVEVFYETDELKDDFLLTTNGGQGIDLMIGSASSFRTYIKRGWLAPLHTGILPNLVHLNKRWQDDALLAEYSTPYLWGTVGIAYRYDLMNRPVKSWMELFQPESDLKGKIMMINDSRDTIGIALKALGFSINSNKTEELNQVEQLLLAQKPFVNSYAYIDLEEDSSIIKGNTWMTMVYSGDGITLTELHPGIRFVVPEEGTNIWSDHIAVMATSNKKELAHQFINFLNEPDNAAKLATTLNFATPNAAARQYLGEAFLSDPRIFPNANILERSEIHQDFSPREQKKRNELFLRVTQ